MKKIAFCIVLGLTMIFAGTLVANVPYTGSTEEMAEAAPSNPYLLKDIFPEGDTICDGGGDIWGGLFSDYCPAARLVKGSGNSIYFVQNDMYHGEEVWISDGTESGTHLVKDIGPCANSSEYVEPPILLASINGILLFVAGDGTPRSLWRSDGTEEGTSIIGNILPINDGCCITPEYYEEIDGVLFFSATNGTDGYELWKSDGTEAGTVLVKDINSGASSSYPEYLTNVNGTLFFGASDTLWKSDGTEAGTLLVTTSTYDPEYLTNVNGTLFFSANNATNGTELWKSDGTEAGTVLVKDINSGTEPSYPSYLTNVNGTLFFFVYNETGEIELWKSDGTEPGTIKVKNVDISFNSNPNMIGVNGTVFFMNADNNLWKSDGTEQGTLMVKDFYNIYYMTSMENKLYLIAGNAAGNGLWESDGTEEGTTIIKNVDFEDSYWLPRPSGLVNVNNLLYFAGDDGTSGMELWKSDGTEAGTLMVKNVSYCPDGNIFGLAVMELMINFIGDDSLHGRELWKSDGTEAGTVLVKDINSGTASSYPYYLTNVNGTLYFSADNGLNGTELWKTDWTEAGTILVKDIYSGTSSSYPENITNVNGTLFFRANNGSNGYELWKTDGTEAGTVLVKDINSGTASSSPSGFTNVNGTLFFRANNGSNGYELWKSDGTEAGTVLVKDIYSGTSSSSPSDFTIVNGTLYFSADNGTNGRELWKTDGTEAGTVLVKDIYSGTSSSSLSGFTIVNGTLYFSANNGTNGSELWKSDGTEASTVLVKDIYSGTSSSSLSGFTIVNGTLYFSANNGTNGSELWKSDGTEASTVLVKDIYSGTSSSQPYYLTNVNGTLYFSASNGTNGRELWKTDGTSSGTVLVKDINGTSSSYPYNLINVNGTLFFTATDGTTGSELWRSDGTQDGTVKISLINSECSTMEYCEIVSTGNRVYFTADSDTYGRSLWAYDLLPQPLCSVNNAADDLCPCADTGVRISWPQDPEAWNDGSVGVRTYDIKRDGITIANNLPYGTMEYVDTEGNNNTPYLYQVSYRNGNGAAGLTDGVIVNDLLSLSPTISSSIPACPTVNLTTQNYSTYQWYRNGTAIFGATNQSYEVVAPGNYSVFVTNTSCENCFQMSPAVTVYNNPDIPAITGDSAGCASVMLSTGMNVGYQWIKDGVDIFGATGQQYYATESGTFSVRVSNSEGCTATSTGKSIVIHPLPVPIVDGPSSGCDLVVLSTGSFASYQWKKDGVDISGEVNQNYTATQSGTFSVRVITGDGCTGTSTGKSVEISSTPTPTIIGEASDCGSVILSTESFNSYQWIKEGVDIPGATAQSFTASETGTYAVRVGTSEICEATSPGRSIEIFPLPVPIVDGPSSGCDLVVLSTGSFASYQWIKDGIDIPGEVNQSCTATQSGTFSVRVTNADSCVGVSSGKALTVFSSPSPSPAVDGLDSGCGTVILSCQSYAAYQWIINGGDIPGATAQFYNAPISGNYSVRVSNSDGCVSTSPSRSITIFPVPEPNISGDHFNTCPATSIPLSTGAFDSYQWYLNNNQIPGAVDQMVNAGTSGSYKVQVTNQEGCMAFSSNFQVFIDFCPQSEVSPSGAVYPLILAKDSASSTGFYIYFQRLDTLDGYNIYEGDIVSPWDGIYHHENKPGNICQATVEDLGIGKMRAEISPGEGNHYYLVTAHGDGIEGPSGYDSQGVEIDPLQNTCTP
ncbi:MAG TPA: hypothetical protein PKJ37_02465 [Acidobacteriota bacterium]|nr:hypothetical protein [Acidobacteriota bacterium]HNT16746.1 hypothetical protein [Acidobacteriota bacterium]